jgi:hypothetical protein
VHGHDEGRRPPPQDCGRRGSLCVHSGRLDFRELGRQGGKARGQKQKGQAGDQLESLAHSAIAELLTNAGGSQTARAAAARLVLDKLAASSPYSAELAKLRTYLSHSRVATDPGKCTNRPAPVARPAEAAMPKWDRRGSPRPYTNGGSEDGGGAVLLNLEPGLRGQIREERLP